eukprot:CAMPEP_0171015698 /NCGR_PEP_ID=MMETSP0736-20130129/26137_1 /TAXON_ID=186038 /ORGANISM="Fragilariopsis kerguelensis, Strain L26-C5" /LENGTH=510 /DNA_ID=CAMNT_0011450683 /DNA_START=1 /DNA_END=1531 /DNA_ORIENTATION=-
MVMKSRQSVALGVVEMMTLDRLRNDMHNQVIVPMNNTGVQKNACVRVLVTVNSITPLYGDLIERGLGLWVGYIIQKYLKLRGINFRLYMKSIITNSSSPLASDTTVKQVVSFIKKNKINYFIPSDVTDTMFVSKYWNEIQQTGVKFCITPSLSVYEHLEDKWETYQMMKEGQIPTPHTIVFDPSVPFEEHQYPFFFKVASGTNAGRGVWHCTNPQELTEALQAKEVVRAKKEKTLLLIQQATYGQIICAEVIYNHGTPLGFFFATSVAAEDLAGQGAKYIQSQDDEYKQKHSHNKVELTDAQWETCTKVFQQLGKETQYHGMIDIEFIIANDTNGEQCADGSVWLLECNPRFSGDIHTTLSNPGFLDLYFQVMNGLDAVTLQGMKCGNYSLGVDMISEFGNYFPTQFYVSNPLNVLNIRHWYQNNYSSWDPSKNPDYIKHDELSSSVMSEAAEASSLASSVRSASGSIASRSSMNITTSQVARMSLVETKALAEQDYPAFNEEEDEDSIK